MSNPVLERAYSRIESGERGLSGVEIPAVAPAKLTIAGVGNRAAATFGVMFAAAAVTWMLQLVQLAMPAMIAGLVLSVVAMFMRKLSPVLVLAYAVCEGVFLGAISWIFDAMWPGIAMQAVLATTVTSAVMFIAYQQRWIRVTARFRSMMTVALFGYLGFAVVNLIASFFGFSIYNTQMGWLVALIGAGLAAFTLVTDFADIESAAALGVDESYEWTFAFGLLVSVVWMYLEILRLLAILRER